MATVTFLKPSDMRDISTDAFSIGDDSTEIRFSAASTAVSLYGSYVPGEFGGVTGLTTSVLVDTNDFALTANFYITGLSFSVGDYEGYFSAPLQLLQLVRDLLTGDDRIEGSSGDDFITAGAGNDVAKGGDGNDWFDGNIGDDKLFGGNGNDFIGGSNGKDLIVGGRGADDLQAYFFGAGPGYFDGARDTFAFRSLEDSGASTDTWDEIFGFVAGDTKTSDRIDLLAIDANPTKKGDQAFKLVDQFTKAKGEIALEKGGGSTLIAIDGDRDQNIDMRILVHGVADLHKDDFIL